MPIHEPPGMHLLSLSTHGASKPQDPGEPYAPDRRGDITRALADMATRLRKTGTHPTRRTQASLWVSHADGTRSHCRYSRPMTTAEAERAEHDEMLVWAENERARMRAEDRWTHRLAAWWRNRTTTPTP